MADLVLQAPAGAAGIAPLPASVEGAARHRCLIVRGWAAGRDVLTIGADAGDAALLAPVSRSVLAVDGNEPAPAPDGVTRRQGDPAALPVDSASIDLALALGGLADEPDQALAELRRVLRPQGLAVLAARIGEGGLTRPAFEALIQRHFAQAAFATRTDCAASLLQAGTPPRLLEPASFEPASFEIVALASDGPLPDLASSILLQPAIAVAPDRPLPPPVQIRQLRSQVLASHADMRAATQRERAMKHELGRVEDRLLQETNGHREAMAALHEAVAARHAAEAGMQAAEAARLAAITAVQQAQHELHVLRSSTMWRATKPARWALARLRGGSVPPPGKPVALAPPPPPPPIRPAPEPALAPTPPAEPGLDAFAPPLRLVLSEAPVVSVLIATYGQARMTLGCLRAIASHPPSTPLEIILVDDAAPPTPEGDALHALAEQAGVRMVRNPANLGFLRTCNATAKRARGRYLYLLNNDTELRPGALDALVDLLEARADAGMAGSKLIYPDGTLQEAGGIVWDDASAWNYGRGQDPARPEFNYVREADYCSGASLLVRRALWEALGGFDEGFAPAYYEDVDLAFRMRAAGHKLLYEPRSVVVHFEGMSHGTDLNEGGKAHQRVNAARMRERWGERLRAEHYPNGTNLLRARDRARDRKVALVMDHYALEPDRDAGSRSTLGIVQSMLDAGWVVKYWPFNQAYQAVYSPQMEAIGVEVIDQRRAEPFGDWLAREGRVLDHVMAIRPEVAAELSGALMRYTDAVLSFYGVDLHFARMRRQATLENDPALATAADLMQQTEKRVWRVFDVVIYPSEEEAAIVRQMAPGTNAFGIVPFSFVVDPPRVALPASARTVLFVAGFAHPPNVDAALFLVQEILPRLEARVGPVQLILAGSNPTAAVQALAAERVTVTGFITDEELAAFYARARVAVVPLRFGAGVKGKVIEALSHGLPVVTTSTGAQGIEGLRGVVPVADDAAALAEALARLMTDDATWMAQSTAQLGFAEANFSRAAMGRSVMTALRSADPTITPA